MVDSEIKTVRPAWFLRAQSLNLGAPGEVYSPERLYFFILALAGEAGELANVAKKMWRGDSTHPPEHFQAELRKELADVRIYCEYVARELQENLDFLCEAKVDELTERVAKRQRKTHTPT